jgi:hypothetical protein
MEAEGRSTVGFLERARAHPVALALVLSLISTPLVAVSLLDPPLAGVDWEPMGLQAALLLAVLVVVPAGLAGGALGGRFLAGRPVLAVFLSLAVAWPVGISMLSIAAAALDVPLLIGSRVQWPYSAITEAEPLSGGVQYVGSVVGGFIFILPPILGLLSLGAARILARRGHVGRGIALVIAGYIALNWLSITFGGLIPFICLSVGVVVWWYLARGQQPAAGPRSIRPVEVTR